MSGADRPGPLTGAIAPEALARYLAAVLRAPVEGLELRGLGEPSDAAVDPKRFGYGVPFEVVCRVDGAVRSFVVSRTRPTQGFGHDYPADRAWQALYGHTAYNDFPRHVRSADVGIVRASGELDSVADAREFFQLVEKAEGTLYWRDLDRLLREPAAERDVERAVALARFLARAHAAKRDEPTLYRPRIRELVAHGECLMGILDSYPPRLHGGHGRNPPVPSAVSAGLPLWPGSPIWPPSPWGTRVRLGHRCLVRARHRVGQVTEFAVHARGTGVAPSQSRNDCEGRRVP